jgi:hypothetical protein
MKATVFLLTCAAMLAAILDFAGAGEIPSAWDDVPDFGVQRVSADQADTSVPCSEEDPNCFGDPAFGSLWTVQAGVIFLNRTGATSTPSNIRGNTGLPFPTIEEFEFPCAAGPQLSVQRHLENGWSIEALYFGMDGHQSTQELQPFAGNGLNVPASALVPTIFRWDSRLYNAEINFRLPERPWITPFVGLRWLELDDKLISPLYYGVSPDDVSMTDRVVNNLYGFQLGTDVHLWNNGGALRLESTLKAGVYNNSASESIAIPVLQGAGDSNSRIDHVAFIGEIGLTGVWQITERLAGRIGYELIWLDGLALPSDQFIVGNTGNGFGGVSADRSVLYHGVTAGLELQF